MCLYFAKSDEERLGAGVEGIVVIQPVEDVIQLSHVCAYVHAPFTEGN